MATSGCAVIESMYALTGVRLWFWYVLTSPGKRKGTGVGWEGEVEVGVEVGVEVALVVGVGEFSVG